jgi:hypothetical protein
MAVFTKFPGPAAEVVTAWLVLGHQDLDRS